MIDRIDREDQEIGRIKMNIRHFLLAGTSVFLLATSNAWAGAPTIPIDGTCSTQVTYALAYFNSVLPGPARLKDASGIVSFGGDGANGNSGLVNAVTNQFGAVATIFVRNYNGDFIRAITNLSLTDLSSGPSHLDPTTAVGTTLTALPSPSAYHSLSLGRQFCGTVSLFGHKFDLGYQPVFDAPPNRKVVIGALFVGFLVP